MLAQEMAAEDFAELMDAEGNIDPERVENWTSADGTAQGAALGMEMDQAIYAYACHPLAFPLKIIMLFWASGKALIACFFRWQRKRVFLRGVRAAFTRHRQDTAPDTKRWEFHHTARFGIQRVD